MGSTRPRRKVQPPAQAEYSAELGAYPLPKMQIRQASGQQICFQGRPVRSWKFDGNRRKITGMGGEPRYRAAYTVLANWSHYGDAYGADQQKILGLKSTRG